MKRDRYVVTNVVSITRTVADTGGEIMPNLLGVLAQSVSALSSDNGINGFKTRSGFEPQSMA